jgi:hypothetical protein
VRAALERAGAAAGAQADGEGREAGARAAARGLARAYAGALLLDQARWSEAAADPAAHLWAAAAARWSAGLAHLLASPPPGSASAEAARRLASEELPAAVEPALPRA